MRGDQTAGLEKLGYSQMSLEERVRANPPLRRIARVIDFEFVYAEVAEKYGIRGHGSVPPAGDLEAHAPMGAVPRAFGAGVNGDNSRAVGLGVGFGLRP